MNAHSKIRCWPRSHMPSRRNYRLKPPPVVY
jgi:hypothetical protein